MTMKSLFTRKTIVVLCLLSPLVFLLGHQYALHFTMTSSMVNNKGLPPVEELLLSDHRKFLQSRALRRWWNDKSFDEYLTSPDVRCKQSDRAGNIGDGGWDICLSGPYHLKPPCLVYSFGINYDFSFDHDIDQRFNCVVKSFDPSMTNTSNHKRGNHIHFMKEGISGKDSTNKYGWQFYSFDTILKKQNDTNKIIDYLKMDVERSEWVALPDMAVKGLFKNIKQIGIEIHCFENGCLKAVGLVDLLEQHGFRKWKMHVNPIPQCAYYKDDGTWGSRCIELYYVNTHFLDKDSIGSFLTN